MNKVVLDTDILSEILKGRNSLVADKAKKYYEFYDTYTITTISVMEIVKGYHKVNREANIQRFLSVLPGLEILTLNNKGSELAGRIYAELERSGQPIGRADPMVAGIALANSLHLCTGNTKHYQRIQNLGFDLALENWRE